MGRLPNQAVSTDMAGWYTENLEEHYTGNQRKLEAVLGENASKLFPRLRVRNRATSERTQ
jgi:hypothetical protein